MEAIVAGIAAAKEAEAAEAREEQRGLRPLVVAQATFKRRHRERIHKAHPDLSFVWVQAEEDERLERLRERAGVVDVALGRKMLEDFEAPDEERHYIFFNKHTQEDSGSARLFETVAAINLLVKA